VTEIHIVSDETISINLIIGRPILNKVTLIMNSEGVMVTEDVTEMKKTNLLNDEKKVQKRIPAEDENTTEENDEKMKIFILSFRQLKGLSESRKKNRGFPFKKNIDDVITRKQMTAGIFFGTKTCIFIN
jgi:hypothetical protein